jgi:hypothetical protein
MILKPPTPKKLPLKNFVKRIGRFSHAHQFTQKAVINYVLLRIHAKNKIANGFLSCIMAGRFLMKKNIFNDSAPEKSSFFVCISFKTGAETFEVTVGFRKGSDLQARYNKDRMQNLT